MTKRIGVIVAAGLALGAPALAGFDHVITFDEAPLGTDANGLIIANAQFSFGFPAARGSGAAIGNGPGVTTYTSDPGIEGTTFGSLGVEFLKPVTGFGFGFAFDTFDYVSDAVSVSLFDGEGNFLTKLTADADPFSYRGKGNVANGFVQASGFESIGGFSVDFADFDGGDGEERGGGGFSRFLFDNLGYDLKNAVVPLPTPAFMGAAGLIGVAAIRRRRGM